MPEEFRSLKGQLLLDSGQLRGSFFHRAVVLICEHNAEGAFGLVLTQKTESKASEVLVGDLPQKLSEHPLFLGGPVQPTALTYLHSDTFIPDANVMANVSMGHSLEGLVEIASSYSTSLELKLFAGYAGWSGGQLEGEMKRKAWLTHTASIELIYHAEPGDLWQTILREKGGTYRLLAEMPDDLSAN
jgi:putative transcriptional regulator